MAMRLLLGLIIAAVLQTAALGWMIQGHWNDLKRGIEVVLETNMRDPRDFFLGHYVTLRLDIQQVKIEKFAPREELENNQPLYLSLEKGEGTYWQVAQVTTKQPESGAFLKSKTNFRSYMISEKNKRKTVRVRLPFTRYYAPKKRAQELEKLRNDRKMGIVVSVLPNGQGKIKGVSVDGKLVYDESLF